LRKPTLRGPKLNLSVKNTLLSLNHDLDLVVSRIREANETNRVIYEHSHSNHDLNFTNLQVCVLYLEDRRFFDHVGVEARAPARVIKRLLLGKRLGGISTIDQQLVRIYTNRRERTLGRKLRETLLAVFINFRLTKHQIFHAYLHDSYFGYKLNGCEIASRHIFKKDAIYLSEEQAAFLASLLPLPLPKSVWELCHDNGFPKDCEPENIISHPEVRDSKWAQRVFHRYQYAKRAYAFKPRSRRRR